MLVTINKDEQVEVEKLDRIDQPHQVFYVFFYENKRFMRAFPATITEDKVAELVKQTVLAEKKCVKCGEMKLKDTADSDINVYAYCSCA